DSYAMGWEFEQCLVNGEDVWCTFGAYEGTGHFLSDSMCVRAKLGETGSLTVVVDDQPITDYPYVPKLYIGANGEVRRAEYAPGSLEVAGMGGDLVCYDESGEPKTIVATLLPESYYSDNRLVCQTAEPLGGAAYLIVAEAIRDEENDIGWRMAYRPGELHYIRVPLSENAEIEALDGKELGVFAEPSAEELFSQFSGTWVLYATEVEGDRSDVLPEGMFEYIDFFEDGTAKLVSTGNNEYSNVFSHAQVIPTNGVSAGAGAYGMLLTSDTNEDMMYTYFEYDTLVATVLMHFDTENGSDSFSRTGFYQRSVG
ncbi:MAG: hypothetical protein J5449_00365, partial [Oscillospiraceae bacterium]|nr:hypothetical protein [Oscillospiraceae bacterium]